MDQQGPQQVFFQHIKNSLPPHLSLVDEVADLLNISNDSAYRRIRGEKELSFDEIRTLCGHFKVSLDHLFHLGESSFLFTSDLGYERHFKFDQYMQDVFSQLHYMNSFDHREMFYLAKDIPVFHLFNFHELAAFKFHFWMKMILQYPLPGRGIFLMEDFAGPLHEAGRKIVEEYNRLPSQEIWNAETINATIGQIEYYKETKMFASADELMKLYACLERTIDHIERQAESGYKMAPTQIHPGTATYKLYVNDFILGDNSILVMLNDTKVVFINHSLINFMTTTDTRFSNNSYQHLQNIIRKSTLISDVGEKERSKFFNGAREKIENRKKAAEHYTP